MPFTFSHPAIILPLQYLPRKWFSLTALIIGSLTPDFEYFIRMRVQSNYSHTCYGIFWFDLPLAILLAFIFHDIVRKDLFNNLPENIKSRVWIFSEFNWDTYFKENWIIILVSTIIGITSHLLWDAFTHNHGYFVEKISKLNKTIFIFENKIPLWKILQHLSTLIGAIIIFIAFLKLPKNATPKSLNIKKYWIIVFSLTIIILVLRFSFSFNIKAFGTIIASLISAFLFSLIITPIVIKFKVNSEI
jgi:hypothetical protein